MARYRKLPVEIEAEHFNCKDVGGQIAEWCGGYQLSFNDIQIETLEGTMSASMGDYIIRGVQGEFYPCKPEIFEATYEEVI